MLSSWTQKNQEIFSLMARKRMSVPLQEKGVLVLKSKTVQSIFKKSYLKTNSISNKLLQTTDFLAFGEHLSNYITILCIRKQILQPGVLTFDKDLTKHELMRYKKILFCCKKLKCIEFSRRGKNQTYLPMFRNGFSRAKRLKLFPFLDTLVKNPDIFKYCTSLTKLQLEIHEGNDPSFHFSQASVFFERFCGFLTKCKSLRILILKIFDEYFYSNPQTVTKLFSCLERSTLASFLVIVSLQSSENIQKIDVEKLASFFSQIDFLKFAYNESFATKGYKREVYFDFEGDSVLDIRPIIKKCVSLKRLELLCHEFGEKEFYQLKLPQTLKSLTVGLHGSDKEQCMIIPLIAESIFSLPTLEHFSILFNRFTEDHVEKLDFLHQVLATRGLKTYKVHFYKKASEMQVKRKLFMPYSIQISQIQSLEKLSFGLCLVEDFSPFEMIFNSLPKLQRLRIGIFDSKKKQNFPFHYLKNLKSLKRLKMRLISFDKAEFLEQVIAELTSLEYLEIISNKDQIGPFEWQDIQKLQSSS